MGADRVTASDRGLGDGAPRTPIVLASDGATLGQVVRRVRVGRALTLGDLAAITGLSKATLSVIENDLCDPRVTTMVRLAEGLRLPLHSLLGHACGQRPLEDS